MAEKNDELLTSCGYKYDPSRFGSVDGVILFAGLTKEVLDAIKNLPVKEGDLFIATYPKSGIYSVECPLNQTNRTRSNIGVVS